jgi:hypothetical protein
MFSTMKTLTIIMILFLSGCASKDINAQCASNLKSIQDAYDKKEISAEKYLELKMKTQQYCNENSFRSRLSRGLSAAGNTMSSNTSPSSSDDLITSSKTGFVTKEGTVVGHQYGDRIVYNDGTSGYVR